MVNELSKALSVAEMKVQYDVQCRKVLAQKEVLAWILKNTAEEIFKSCRWKKLRDVLKECRRLQQLE